MKINKIIIIVLVLITGCCSVCLPVLKPSISVSELDGTNGLSFYDSLLPKDGISRSFFIDNSNDIIIYGRSNMYFISEIPNVPLYDLRLLNGTNGVISKERVRSITGHKADCWTSEVCWAAVSDIFMDGQRAFHLLSGHSNAMPPIVSLTDSLWSVSQRIYITNNPPDGAPLLLGNFLKGYPRCIAYYATKKGVVVMPLDSIKTGVEIRTAPGSNSVHFIGPYTGCYSAPVGDANGDGYEDLLIGTWNNDEMWLVFGGRNWTGDVELSSIGTNGVVFKAYNKVAGVGDMNDDGIQDIIYSDREYHPPIDEFPSYYTFHTTVAYGRTNWPTHFSFKSLNERTGFIIPMFPGPEALAGKGDVNNDGHEDFGIINRDLSRKLYLFYGGPFINPFLQYPDLNGTNGFLIIGEDSSFNWANIDINGDVNGDGFDDITFSIINNSKPIKYARLVYGEQSPSAPPALRTPLWINVGCSNGLSYELESVPTNITWTGCKKGDDYTLCYTNGARCTTWDIPMGKLWFTNSYTISTTSTIFSVSYTSTNALGSAAGFTTLTIEPVPEPITTGIVVLATALIGKALSNK